MSYDHKPALAELTKTFAAIKSQERRKRQFQRDNKGRGFARAIHRAARLKEERNGKESN